MSARRKPAVVEGHRISWWVWAFGPPGSGLTPEKMRHTSRMRGGWGWDASCSCGWESRTGGALRRYVEGKVWDHKFGVATDAERDRLIGVVR